MTPLNILGLSAVIVLAAVARAEPAPGNSLFYFPTRDQPATPANWGHRHEDIHFTSADGTPLHGWWIHPRMERAKGAVVFSHGNAGSIGHHLGFVIWLADAGYHVLIYDYRGFGQSGGEVDRNGMVDDATAALAYAANHPQLGKLPLISYGHSLGGAKSVAAVAGAELPKLKAVIIDATFASYREMALHVGGRLGSSLVSDDLAPVGLIPEVSPVPLLVIHGRKDQVVPFSQGLKLFRAARQPKTLFEVEDGQHGNALTVGGGACRKRMLAWLEKVLTQ